MFGTISASTNLNKKARMSFMVRRAGSDEWENLGIWWNIKQFMRESSIQFCNLFRKEKGYATVLTQVGEEFIVDKLDETVQTKPEYVGWGTGAGTAAKADTTLFTEATEARTLGTLTQTAVDKLRNVATITCAGAGKTITNAGSLTASTAGTLVIHGDFTGIALNVGDSIQFTIDLEIT